MVGDRAIGRRALPLNASPDRDRRNSRGVLNLALNIGPSCFDKFPAVQTSSEARYTARATSNTNGAASSHSMSVHTLCEVFIAVTRSPWAAATSSNLAIAAST
jgi:hypothetical protein